MRIGITGYFNPYEVKDYFFPGTKVPNFNMSPSVNATVRGLLDEGHHVTVFTTFNNEGEPIMISGERICVYAISSKPAMSFLGFLNRILMVRKIRKMIEHNVENLDVLHAQWTYDFALAAKSFSKKIPVFCTVRDWCPYILSIARWRELPYWLVSYYVFKKVMRGDDIHFIANSPYTLNMIKKTYPEKEVPIIPNPIIKEFILKERISYPINPVFVSISQTLDDSRKNIINLLLAFHEYRKRIVDAKLILVGGYTNDIIKHWKDQCLLEGVEFTGRLTHKELFDVLDNATALIHPSYEETFGNILLEGISRRIPCIGGEDSGAVPYVLGNGNFGILCNVHDKDDILRAMNLTEDKKRMQILVNKATEHLITNYRNDAVARQHISIYKQYLN